MKLENETKQAGWESESLSFGIGTYVLAAWMMTWFGKNTNEWRRACRRWLLVPEANAPVDCPPSPSSRTNQICCCSKQEEAAQLRSRLIFDRHVIYIPFRVIRVYHLSMQHHVLRTNIQNSCPRNQPLLPPSSSNTRGFPRARGLPPPCSLNIVLYPFPQIHHILFTQRLHGPHNRRRPARVLGLEHGREGRSGRFAGSRVLLRVRLLPKVQE